MMTVEEIKKDIWQRTCAFLQEAHSPTIDNKILHVILSASSQALEFVCLLEDEYEIEFDDDEIDLDFFSSFDKIAETVFRHLHTDHAT